MLTFNGPIPISIRPGFWIFAALIGFFWSHSFLGTVIWMAIILFSVLFHEFGHALTARAFGRRPRIEIVALGGLTIHDGQDLSSWKQFFIVLNGPLFGLLLAGLAWISMKISYLSTGLPGQILMDVMIINVFWTVVNLLPIMPLDGGQMLRIILEAFFGAKGLRYAIATGVILSVIISLILFVTQDFLLGAFFFLFAFQGFEMWRATHGLVDVDRQKNFKEIFLAAEEAFLAGRKTQAKELFLELRAQAKRGLLWRTATQQLGVLYYDQGKHEDAYALLQEVQRNLGDEAASILHELAFEYGNYPLVVSLAPQVFCLSQEADVALRSAYASAQLKLAKLSIGWLKTAIEQGINAADALSSSFFDPLRNDPKFEKFLRSLQ